MTTTDTLVVGGGQAGLALSRCLTARGRDHLVLERGRVGERWRSERWDSFRLLTPTWLTRLPGRDDPGRDDPGRDDPGSDHPGPDDPRPDHPGPDPHGFLARDEVVALLEGYARDGEVPVVEGVTVRAARRAGDRWHVETDAGPIRARALVVATGGLGAPALPGRLAMTVPPRVAQVHSARYRRPDALPDGAVLVVGAGPSGQQIARELAAAGRRVHLAVGRHRVLPRRYRGRDAYDWLDALGLLRATAPGGRPRRRPSPGVVLAGGRGDLDLRILAARGVVVHGRLLGVTGGRAQFADDLAASLTGAEANAARFRERVDAHLREQGVPAPPSAGTSRVPRWAVEPRRALDLAGIGAVVWATGFRPDFSWVQVPVFDADGTPRHRRGVTAVPGLAFLGLHWQHHRSSHQIDGVGADAVHLAAWLDAGAAAIAA